MAFKFSAEAKEFVPAATQQSARQLQYQHGGEKKGPKQDETLSQDTKRSASLVRSLCVTAPEFIPHFGAPSYKKPQFGNDVVSDFTSCTQRVLSWADESSKNVVRNVYATQSKQTAVHPQASKSQWGFDKDAVRSDQKRNDNDKRKDWNPKTKGKTKGQTSETWAKDKIAEKLSKNMKFDESDARSKRKSPAPKKQKAKEDDIQNDFSKQSKEASNIAKAKSDVDRSDNEIVENQKGKIHPAAKHSPNKAATRNTVADTNNLLQEKKLWMQKKSFVNEKKPQNVTEDPFPALGKQNPQIRATNVDAPKQNSWSKIVQHQPTKKEVDVKFRRDTEGTLKMNHQNENKGSNEHIARNKSGSQMSGPQMRGASREGTQTDGRSRAWSKDAVQGPEQRPNRSSFFKNVRRRDEITSETRQKPKVFESYQGDLEWRRESADAKKEHSFSHTRDRGRNPVYSINSRKPVQRESPTWEKGLRENGMVTEQYRYDFVTKRFSDSVKRKLLGASKNENIVLDEVRKDETSRGWYGDHLFGASGTELDHCNLKRKDNFGNVGTLTWSKTTVEPKQLNKGIKDSSSRMANQDLKKPMTAWANRNDQLKTSNRIFPHCKGVLDASSCLGKSKRHTSQQINVCNCVTDYQRGTAGKDLNVRNDRSIQGNSMDRPSVFSSGVNQGEVRKGGQVAVISPGKDRGNKSTDLNVKSFEEIVDLEVEEDVEGYSEDNGVDDDDGWITVEEKSKVKSRRRQQNEAGKQEITEPVLVKKIVNREEREQREQRFKNRSNDGRRGNERMSEKDFGNEGKGRKQEGKSQREEGRNKSNNPKAIAEKKVSTVKKKSKRKEIPMYENDQKKIKEFKMRQMIEEDLKLDLLQMTRTRYTHDRAIDGEEDSAKEAWPAIGHANIRTASAMSFSEVLKQRSAPKVQVRAVPRAPGVLKVDPLKLTEEERIELKRKKFKEKRKLKKKERKEKKRAEKEENNAAVGGEEKETLLSKTPINLDLASMFDRLLKSTDEANEPKPAKQIHNKSAKTPKRTILSTGVISMASGVVKSSNKDGRKADTKVSANALDSTQPVRMRGKERERPKRKRLTMLKKAILREREEKRKKREAEERIDNNDNEKMNDENDEPNSKKSREDHKTSREDKVENSETAAVGHGEQAVVCEGSKDTDTSKQSVQDFPTTCEPLNSLPQEIISKIHNRKFREYCDQFLTKEIDQLVCKILKDLLRFQTRAYLENPNKAKAKRRLVLGIREVSRHLKLSKLKCVIMAPNLEKVSTEGGIDHHLGKIIFDSKQFSIPIIYSMSRQTLGITLKRKVPASVVGIFNYAGVEDDYKKLCTLVEEQREKYKLKIERLMMTLEEGAPMQEASARNAQRKPKRDNRQSNRDRNDNRQFDRTQREVICVEKEAADVSAGMNYDYTFC